MASCFKICLKLSIVFKWTVCVCVFYSMTENSILYDIPGRLEQSFANSLPLSGAGKTDVLCC